MQKSIIKVLKDKGYDYNQHAQNIIAECDDWYSARQTAFHKRTNVNGVALSIPVLGFGKRLCEDDANLCEVAEVNGGESDAQFDGINDILKRNRFDVMYRKQLEKVSAVGTVGCYIRLDDAQMNADNVVVSGKVSINYCDAENIVPLTVINDEIIECAFVGQNLVKGAKQSVLVIFTKGEDGRYTAETDYFDSKGRLVADMSNTIQLGEVKPFAIMRTANVNNLDDMEGYGYPKIYGAIPFLQALDLAFFILHGDLDKGDKLLFINELLASINTDINGNPCLTKEQKKLFILLGEKLPNQQDLIYEYNPELRIGSVRDTFELLLSLLSMMFGYGTKKYTFEGGQIKSATEYIGERQDALQEVNRQRTESVQYITDIVKAIIWFADTFEGASWSEEQEVVVDFDDSYITDKTVELERMRNDAMTFDIPEILVWYMMEAYNLSDEEAKALVYKSEQAEDEAERTDADSGEE